MYQHPNPPPTTNRYVQFQSSSRDTSIYPDASSYVLKLQDYINNAIEIECIQMEFGNIRNTIEEDVNNTFIFSDVCCIFATRFHVDHRHDQCTYTGNEYGLQCQYIAYPL
jgi:hypothetical protein